MLLPKEIQNLILTRYYFNQWKEKIEKVNLDYHRYFRLRDCVYCRKSTCQCLCWYNPDYQYAFVFNYRCLNLSKKIEIEDIAIDILNWYKFGQNECECDCVVGKLPNTYLFSSG